MYIYYLVSVNPRDFDILGSVYISNNKIKDENIWDYEPADFFGDESLMDSYNVIGTGGLIKNWIGGRLFMSPCNMYVHVQKRGQGIGKLLYNCILKGIELHTSKLKTRPYLAQHSVIEPVDLTSEDSNKIYKSLIRDKTLSLSFATCNCLSDCLDSNEYRGDIFRINRFPENLQCIFVKKIQQSISDVRQNWTDVEFDLWEIKETGTGS